MSTSRLSTSKNVQDIEARSVLAMNVCRLLQRVMPSHTTTVHTHRSASSSTSAAARFTCIAWDEASPQWSSRRRLARPPTRGSRCSHRYRASHAHRGAIATESDGATHQSEQGFSDDLHCVLIASKEHGPFVIAAHSLGGMIALYVVASAHKVLNEDAGNGAGLSLGFWCRQFG